VAACTFEATTIFGELKNKSSHNMMKRILGILVSIVVLFVLLLVRPMQRNADSFSRADSLAANGDYQGAYYAYGDVIRRKPQDPLAYFRRGVAMHQSGQFNKAIVDLNDAIRLKPDFGAAYRLRARAYEGQRLTEKATADDQAADRLQAPTDIATVYAIKAL
jgi:tetratricopeptide (TPR) repeat protein